MSISIYSATVPSYLQILRSVASLLDKAQAHCVAKGLPETELTQARLADDMFPFAFQVTSTAHHSWGAINGLKKGVFSPQREMPEDFATLKGIVARALEGLESLDEDQVNGFEGKPMRFEFGEIRKDYIAEQFLLSFSQPNFYFHVTTAYDLLRWKGLKIAKRDFVGTLRTI